MPGKSKTSSTIDVYKRQGTRTVVSVENPVAHRRTRNVDDAGGVHTEFGETCQVGLREILAPPRHQTDWHRPKTCTQRGMDGTSTETPDTCLLYTSRCV